jgi:hypothetical protein
MDIKVAIDRINNTYIHGDYPRMEQYCREFLQTHDHIYVQYELAIAKLHNRDLLGGLRYYKARWASPQLKPLMAQLVKHARYLDTWEAVQNQSMIITGEQGYGDELLFSRVLAPLQQACAKILVVSSKPVQPVLQYNYPALEFVGQGEPLNHRIGEFYGIATLADMFRAYTLHYGTLPPVPVYRAARPIHNPRAKPTIALVHKAGAVGDNAADRSIDLAVFRDLADDFDVYSFQVPEEPVAFATDTLGRRFHSFMDTANYLSGIDIAVSCDTAFAHLALNMGKPTVLVHDKYIDWRWKNALYPAVKVVNSRALRQTLLTI